MYFRWMCHTSRVCREMKSSYAYLCPAIFGFPARSNRNPLSRNPVTPQPSSGHPQNGERKYSRCFHSCNTTSQFPQGHWNNPQSPSMRVVRR